jgi:hypothetical protein
VPGNLWSSSSQNQRFKPTSRLGNINTIVTFNITYHNAPGLKCIQIIYAIVSRSRTISYKVTNALLGVMHGFWFWFLFLLACFSKDASVVIG